MRSDFWIPTGKQIIMHTMVLLTPRRATTRSSSNGPLLAERYPSMLIVCLKYAQSMRQLLKRAQNAPGGRWALPRSPRKTWSPNEAVDPMLFTVTWRRVLGSHCKHMWPIVRLGKCLGPPGSPSGPRQKLWWKYVFPPPRLHEAWEVVLVIYIY